MAHSSKVHQKSSAKLHVIHPSTIPSLGGGSTLEVLWYPSQGIGFKPPLLCLEYDLKSYQDIVKMHVGLLWYCIL